MLKCFRFEDQLQQWLYEDSGAFTDSTSFPLYLPQTLVSLPQTIAPVMKTSTPSPQVRRECIWHYIRIRHKMAGIKVMIDLLYDMMSDKL